MSAVTPKVKAHEQLPPLASRFVAAESIPWEKTVYEGVEVKTMLVDPATGLMTQLLKMAPGAKLPDHEHVLIEQTWMLEGRLVCGEGECTPGNFVWRPAGSRHEAWAGAEGGLMIAMFQIPNRFYEKDGREIDFLGNDWKASWGEAYERLETARI